jgi:hypothetical protein
MCSHQTSVLVLTALHNRHCSRLAPAVYGYWRDTSADNNNASNTGCSSKLVVKCLKPKEQAYEVAAFWGFNGFCSVNGNGRAVKE